MLSVHVATSWCRIMSVHVAPSSGGIMSVHVATSVAFTSHGSKDQKSTELWGIMSMNPNPP